ncbi:MAG: hypothetical protein J2P56_06915 [Verrucomicrobia bacterium]|nr:hypothetical protein [Verrucomicrobiota bacterium]
MPKSTPKAQLFGGKAAIALPTRSTFVTQKFLVKCRNGRLPNVIIVGARSFRPDNKRKRS